MKIDYAPFIDRVIQRYEGGYGWDENDPGGPTKYGITCFDLAEHMGEKMTSMAAWAPLVQAMTLQTAEAIYSTKYAAACCFDDLVTGADCVILDFGINSGPSTSVRCSQKVVGVAIDGVLGPVTLKAVNGYDPSKFINALCVERLTFLRSLSIWWTFGTGWTARINDLRAYSLALAMPKPAGIVSEAATYTDKLVRIPSAHAKGYPE